MAVVGQCCEKLFTCDMGISLLVEVGGIYIHLQHHLTLQTFVGRVKSQ